MTTPFLDLRSWLACLEGRKRLHRIRCPVDKDTELACIVRWFIESTARESAGALLFEKIAGHQAPVAVNLYPTHELYAAALGVAADGLLEHWAAAVTAPLAPVVVERAPVQEVVETGRDASLNSIPIPVWTPGRDAGPYLSAAQIITKDPETGIQNLGCYRMQVHGPQRLGLFFGSKLQHGAMHFARYCERGVPMPVAIVVGAPPAVNFAAAAKTAYGVDELTIAGGLMGRPLEVAKGHSVDLLVPAQAECVIEGLVPPNARLTEGPFGEALGYMNGAAPAPYVEVTAICHRREPIHHGYIQQLPPSEGHLVMEMGVLGPLWHALTRRLHLNGITDLGIAPGSAGLATLIVQVARSHRNQAASIGRAIAQINFGQRFIYLVDEDIDIRDAETLNWALSSRVDPQRDLTIVDGTKTFQLDPAVMARAQSDGAELGEPPYRTSMAIVDATTKCDVPDLSLPSEALMRRALARWDELDLPPMSPRKRLRRLLEMEDQK